MAIKNGHGKVKLLLDIFFVPSLAYNLLSVGQFVAGGYSILFDDASCCIKVNKTSQVIAHVRMTINKMFPLEVSCIGHHRLVAIEKNEYLVCHLHFGHLNINGLKLLNQKEMVAGLTRIDTLNVLCEGCLYDVKDVCMESNVESYFLLERHDGELDMFLN